MQTKWRNFRHETRTIRSYFDISTGVYWALWTKDIWKLTCAANLPTQTSTCSLVSSPTGTQFKNHDRTTEQTAPPQTNSRARKKEKSHKSRTVLKHTSLLCILLVTQHLFKNWQCLVHLFDIPLFQSTIHQRCKCWTNQTNPTLINCIKLEYTPNMTGRNYASAVVLCLNWACVFKTKSGVASCWEESSTTYSS